MGVVVVAAMASGYAGRRGPGVRMHAQHSDSDSEKQRSRQRKCKCQVPSARRHAVALSSRLHMHMLHMHACMYRALSASDLYLYLAGYRSKPLALYAWHTLQHFLHLLRGNYF